MLGVLKFLRFDGVQRSHQHLIHLARPGVRWGRFFPGVACEPWETLAGMAHPVCGNVSQQIWIWIWCQERSENFGENRTKFGISACGQGCGSSICRKQRRGRG